ncbi:MAG: hypothetical protein Q4G34_03025 [Micrococcus sp.]|nr:hypothetical protein [Micrococcus sp.]
MRVTSEPFRVPGNPDALARLRDRLADVAIPNDSPGAAEVSGMPMSRLAGLVSRWRESFD